MATQKQKKKYLKYYEMMKGGEKRPPRHTWTAAQYIGASPKEKQLAKAGISYKKVRRLKGK